MKTAFLFSTAGMNDNYAHAAYQTIFPFIIKQKKHINKHILVGYVLPKWKELLALFIETRIRKYNNDIWNRLRPEKNQALITNMPFVMCLESINKELCITLNNALQNVTITLEPSKYMIVKMPFTGVLPVPCMLLRNVSVTVKGKLSPSHLPNLTFLAGHK